MTRAVTLALCLCAVGCGEGGILEIDLGLPALSPPPSTARFAFIQARTAPEGPFASVWEGDDPDGTALESAPIRLPVSVVAESDQVEAPLHVRIRYCVDPRCAVFEDTSATEAQLTIERAFYSGERTFLVFDAPPASPVTTHELAIEKCDIRGCVGGTTSMFCRSDGTHFCE